MVFWFSILFKCFRQFTQLDRQGIKSVVSYEKDGMMRIVGCLMVKPFTTSFLFPSVVVSFKYGCFVDESLN